MSSIASPHAEQPIPSPDSLMQIRRDLAETKPAGTARPATPTARSLSGAASRPELFLTPRVLDGSAFAEYSESLRALIRDLDERSLRLTSTSADTDKLCRVLRQAAQQLQQRTEAGSTLAKRLDAQVAAANAAVQRVTHAVGDEAALARFADETAAKRRAALELAVERSLAGMEEKFRAAESRAAQAEQRALAAEQRLESLAARFDAVAAQTDSIARRAAEAVEEAESRADRAAANAIEALEQLRTLAGDLYAKTESEAQAIETRLGPIRDLLASAGDLIGTPDAPGALPASIDEARDRHARLAALNIDTAANIASAAEAHTTIIDTVNAAAESLETLKTRRDQICEAIEQEIDSLGSEISPIEHAAASLARTIDELTGRAQTLHAEIERAKLAAGEPFERAEQRVSQKITDMQQAAQGITQQALQQVEEAAGWLAALAAQAVPPEPIREPTPKAPNSGE